MTHQTAFLTIFIVYVLFTSAAMITLGVPIYPDSYFFVLLVPVLFIKRTRRFILDWIPFLLLFLAYEFLRGLAYTLESHAHYQVGYKVFERLISNDPLPVTFQNLFYEPGTLHFYDYIATILYFFHFVAPLTFAFVLWIRNRTQFLRFTWAFLTLSYAGLITFVIFPTAPPWLASQKGYIDHIYKILDVTLRSFPDRLHLPTIYHNFDPNPVAAIPSLHAAFPTLIFLYAVRFFGLRGLIVAPYMVGVWLAVIYLGEHYLTDVLIGIAYAAASFVIIEKAFASEKLKSWLKEKWQFLSKTVHTSQN